MRRAQRQARTASPKKGGLATNISKALKRYNAYRTLERRLFRKLAERAKARKAEERRDWERMARLQRRKEREAGRAYMKGD